MSNIPRNDDVGPGKPSSGPHPAHPDTLSGETGKHPLGALAGALIGRLVGKQIAEHVSPANPLTEHAYWSQHYRLRPYVKPGDEYELFGPAYQHGWDAYHLHPGKSFEEIAPELRAKWESHEPKPSLEWERAQEAAGDAWERMHQRHSELRPDKAE